MDASDFGGVFNRALERAIAEARQADDRIGPRPCWIEFHGEGLSAARMDEARALKLLLRPDETYPFIVDLSVVAVAPGGKPVVFLRPSGHPRVPYEQTWAPDQFGPFRFLESASIERRPT